MLPLIQLLMLLVVSAAWPITLSTSLTGIQVATNNNGQIYVAYYDGAFVVAAYYTNNGSQIWSRSLTVSGTPAEIMVSYVLYNSVYDTVHAFVEGATNVGLVGGSGKNGETTTFYLTYTASTGALTRTLFYDAGNSQSTITTALSAAVSPSGDVYLTYMNVKGTVRNLFVYRVSSVATQGSNTAGTLIYTQSLSATFYSTPPSSAVDATGLLYILTTGTSSNMQYLVYDNTNTQVVAATNVQSNPFSGSSLMTLPGGRGLQYFTSATTLSYYINSIIAQGSVDIPSANVGVMAVDNFNSRTFVSTGNNGSFVSIVNGALNYTYNTQIASAAVAAALAYDQYSQKVFMSYQQAVYQVNLHIPMAIISTTTSTLATTTTRTAPSSTSTTTTSTKTTTSFTSAASTKTSLTSSTLKFSSITVLVASATTSTSFRVSSSAITTSSIAVNLIQSLVVVGTSSMSSTSRQSVTGNIAGTQSQSADSSTLQQTTQLQWNFGTLSQFWFSHEVLSDPTTGKLGVDNGAAAVLSVSAVAFWSIAIPAIIVLSGSIGAITYMMVKRRPNKPMA